MVTKLYLKATIGFNISIEPPHPLEKNLGQSHFSRDPKMPSIADNWVGSASIAVSLAGR
jgi:hypothetical protein